MRNLFRQSTVRTFRVGPRLSATDGDTVINTDTLVAADVLISKADAQFAPKTSAVNPSVDAGAAGYYLVTIDATDTATVGRLVVYIHKSGSLYMIVEGIVVSAAIYDWVTGATAPNTIAPATPTNVSDVGTAVVAVGNAVAALNDLSGQEIVDALDLAPTGDAPAAKSPNARLREVRAEALGVVVSVPAAGTLAYKSEAGATVKTVTYDADGNRSVA